MERLFPKTKRFCDNARLGFAAPEAVTSYDALSALISNALAPAPRSATGSVLG